MRYSSRIKDFKKEDEKVIVSIDGDRYITINNQILDFIESLTSGKLAESDCDLHYSVIKKLCRLGVISDNLEESKKIDENEDLLLIRKEFPPNFLIEFLIKKISIVFSVKLVKLFFLLVLLSISIILYLFKDGFRFEYAYIINLDVFTLFTLTILFLLSSILHEIGHLAALFNFTKKINPMGIGVFGVFPVFYSDVTPCYMCEKKERIIIMSAGILVQLFFGVCVFIAFPYSEISRLFLLGILLLSAINMFPTYRSDGYWILSDCMGYREPIKDLKNKLINRELVVGDAMVVATLASGVLVYMYFVLKIIVFDNPSYILDVLKDNNLKDNIVGLFFVSLQYIAVISIFLRFFSSIKKRKTTMISFKSGLLEWLAKKANDRHRLKRPD